MNEEPQRSRLGRGLAALMGDAADDITVTAGSDRNVPIAFIEPNRLNPRKVFDEPELDELADSIRQKGIIQPIVVRAKVGTKNRYEIVAGERRWRAAQRAGLHDVPIVLIEASDQEALEIAIVENVQRSNLNAFEEAAGYERLTTDFGYIQSDIAKIVGKSRSHIANMMRLLKLPDSVKLSVINGELSAGHARALLTASDPEGLAQSAVAKGWTVRDVERAAQPSQSPRSVHAAPAPAEKDPDTLSLERALEDFLGLNVSIHHGARGGEIRIRYNTIEQLEMVCRRLKD